MVNDNGQNVLDQQVQKGQLVVIPQGFAYVVQSQNNFEWISFKTNANAMISTLNLPSQTDSDEHEGDSFEHEGDSFGD